MSDNFSNAFLLAAAPLQLDLGGTEHLPLAVLPCLHGLDLTARTAFREDL